MRSHPRALLGLWGLWALCLAAAAPLACGEAPPAAQASAVDPELGRLVDEIDALLAVPQDDYPNGSEVSGAFEQLLEVVLRQPRTLRTDRVAKSMGYFIAHGHGLGWDPQQEDVARLAADWRELRTDLLGGS